MNDGAVTVSCSRCGSPAPAADQVPGTPAGCDACVGAAMDAQRCIVCLDPSAAATTFYCGLDCCDACAAMLAAYRRAAGMGAPCTCSGKFADPSCPVHGGKRRAA